MCGPTKVAQAYQWLSCVKRFTVGPLMATIFSNNEVLHKLLCDISQDEGWTFHKNYKMMFQG